MAVHVQVAAREGRACLALDDVAVLVWQGRHPHACMQVGVVLAGCLILRAVGDTLSQADIALQQALANITGRQQSVDMPRHAADLMYYHRAQYWWLQC